MQKLNQNLNNTFVKAEHSLSNLGKKIKSSRLGDTQIIQKNFKSFSERSQYMISLNNQNNWDKHELIELNKKIGKLNNEIKIKKVNITYEFD